MKPINSKNLLILGTVFSLVACSGGGGGAASSGGSGSNIDLSVSAQFIDAPVNGLTWSVVGNDSINGRTQNSGNFSCTRGQLISFEIGQVGKGLHLGNAVCGEKIFVADLDSVEADADADKIAAILQTVAPPSGDLNVPMVIPAAFSTLDLLAQTTILVRSAKDQVFTANAPTALFDELKVVVPEIASNTPVTTVAARVHLDNAVNAYTDTDTLDSLFGEYSIPTADMPHTAFNSAISREKEIRVFKRGSGSCNMIDLDFYLGVEKTDQNEYFAYGYTAYDSDDVMYGHDTVTYCETIYNSGAFTEYDQQCFGTYLFPKRRLSTNSISVRTKFKDYDLYLEDHPGGAVDLNDAVNLYDTVGSLYVDGTRLKGRIVLTREDGLDSNEYGHLPESCTFNIDQAFDEVFDDEDDDDLSSHYPAFAFGKWTNPDAPVCTGENFMFPESVGFYGVSVGEFNVVDYIISSEEVGTVVGYTTTFYESGNWIIYQAFTDGFFKATFVNQNDVTFKFEKTNGDSCSGSFVPDVEP